MKEILLNDNPLNVADISFPVLIHGAESSGASLYTISLAANMAAELSQILFLCGHEHAEAEFREQVPIFSNVRFFTKGQIEPFKSCLADTEKQVVFVKNIELFDEALIAEVQKHAERFVLSGDVAQCDYLLKQFDNLFETFILFSSLPNKPLPSLETYTGFLESKSSQGTTSLRYT